MGLLMVILSILHLSDDQIEQEPLYQLLGHLGLHTSAALDGSLPGWLDMVEKKLPRQSYLERDKIPDRLDSNGCEVFLYRKGARAKLEVPVSNVMRFVALVFGEELTDIQLQEAKEGEEGEDEEEEAEEGAP
jgi:hypothetical protein